MMKQNPVHHQLIFIFLLSICAASTTAAPLKMARKDCQSKCGNVTIPYPFGIGPKPSCYLDEWFQIDCNESTEGIQKPFLRRTNLEVVNISTHGRLKVYSPITVFCEENKSSELADLRDSPFVYSWSRNTFTAVSCDSSAVVSSEFIVGGCRSVCNPNYYPDWPITGCDVGINCCQTSIPPYLTVVNATLLDNTTNCDKFAFLSDRYWFAGLSYGTSFSTIKSMGKVPVTLDWRINNNTGPFDLYSNFIVTDTQYDDETQYDDVVETQYDDDDAVSYYYGNYPGYTTLQDPWDPACYVATTLAGPFNWTEIYCSCKRGFEGNPYLGKTSCSDIDECQHPNRCHRSKCVNIHGSYDCDDNRSKLILTASLSSSIGLLLLLICAWFGYKFLKKMNEIKRKKMFFKRNGGLLLEQQLSSGEVNVEKIKLFKSQELEKSTDNYNADRILGQGRQGTVYKGMLEDGRIVAVKKSKMVDESQVSEFINEVVILSQINHRNVVQLLGCCLETEVPLLVYEFIPNGTLSKYITEENEEFPLTWKMRLRIATEIAGALSYLHNAASFPIYHRDIKSTNILLDEKYRAKVADFGTSRSIAIDQTHLTTSLVHGTFGYLDPEYFQSSQFTEKSDVYSFGVVLVELLTGQKPISFLRSENEGKSLATYFIISMHEDRLFEILDAQVLKEGSKVDITVVANLARRCLNLNGRKRPTMREVTAELEVIQISGKSSNGEQNHEEVAFVRTEFVEPWDTASSSTGTGTGTSALDIAGRGSSFHEIPLLSFNAR